MPDRILAQKVLLPELELRLVKWRRGNSTLNLFVDKRSECEVCPRCATPSRSVYDHREVKVRDSPLRGKDVILHIRKRRFACKPCGKPFTEPVPGVRKGYRTTDRYEKGLLWACENFADLKAVRKAYRCSDGKLYDALYRQLELRRRRRLYPWPHTIGIDEHFFRRGKGGFPEFVTMVVDYKNKRLMEVVLGRKGAELTAGLAHIPGRENVRRVVCDLSDPYKSFAKSFFPNAAIVADKFHALRLLNPAIARRRKAITGNRRCAKLRRLLLRNGTKLSAAERHHLGNWLDKHPELKEVYGYKEALFRLYRTRGKPKAAKALTKLTDKMAESKLAEIQTLRRTLMKWRNEILAYFEHRITNARTEGYNNKAKVVKRRAYGYRSPENYRLRLLNACA